MDKEIWKSVSVMYEFRSDASGSDLEEPYEHGDVVELNVPEKLKPVRIGRTIIKGRNASPSVHICPDCPERAETEAAAESTGRSVTRNTQ